MEVTLALLGEELRVAHALFRKFDARAKGLCLRPSPIQIALEVLKNENF
jgi:hypothetical protein